jgi:hypothetical protein
MGIEGVCAVYFLILRFITVYLTRLGASKPVFEPTGYFQQKILEYEEQKKQKKSKEKTVR